MRYLIFVLVALSLTGCITDKFYGVGKTIYVGGKAVVIQNADMLDEKTLNKLKSIDDKATRYDTARTTIKKSLKTNVDMNSTYVKKIK